MPNPKPKPKPAPKPKLKMKIERFAWGWNKTILVGELETSLTSVAGIEATLYLGEKDMGWILIEGEIHRRNGRRDLWTRARLSMSRELLQAQGCWLIAPSKGIPPA